MIFADKLIRLRKRMGLSQEELADKMNVSRQAVSKWEGAQSIPDLEKILQLSVLFNVSTDYLLKDELEIEDFVDDGSLVKVLTLNEVNEYISHEEKSSIKIALATLLCIISPATLIFLTILSDNSLNYIPENIAVIIGLLVLFGCVLTAVIIFVNCGFSSNKYKYILEEDFTTEYGVAGIIKDKREKFRDKYNKTNLLGIILCIISPVLLIVSSFFDNVLLISIAMVLLFILVAIAVFGFVIVGTKWGSYQRILHEGEFDKKEIDNPQNKYLSAYWLIIVAIYLGFSFVSNWWHITWVVWPIASLLYVALLIIFNNNKK